jgi:hypothetical protein
MTVDLFGQLGAWAFGKGYNSVMMRGSGGMHMTPGSSNAKVDGEKLRASRGPLLIVGKTGSRFMASLDQAYAGLGVATPVVGSIFQVRELLMYVGAGDVAYNGAALPGIAASSTLSYIKKVGAAYPGPPYQAGHAQPSAPFIFAIDVPSAGHTAMSAAVAVVIWRVDSISGQPSLMSLPSNVVTLNKQSLGIQFPEVDLNGQDIWGIGVCKLGFLDLGVFYELPTSLGGEVLETDLNYTRDLGATSVLAFNVEDATNATPIVVKGTAHPLITGDRVIIASVVGNTAANGSWVVTVVDADNFSLDDSVGSGGYVSGGTVGTDIVQAAGGAFDAADIGRRLDVAAFSSAVRVIDSPTEIRADDLNTTGATITDDGTLTGGVGGVGRSIEISWSNGALLEQDLAPDRAFPPPAFRFAGVINDVLFGEGEDGIIYVSEPGYIGSFPRSSAIFATGAGVLYLRAGSQVTIRFETNAIGAMYYVGGLRPLEYQTVIENQGIKYAQNAGLGFKARVLAWLGQPTVIDDGTLEPDPAYAKDVISEFAGWTAAQTAAMPIVQAYDPKGKYECWCFQKKIMAKYVPTGEWCAPENLGDRVTGNIVERITTAHVLLLVCEDGAGLKLYEYDAGTGSVMVVVSDDIMGGGYGDTINEVMAQIRADRVDKKVKLEILTNYNAADAQAVTVLDDFPAQIGTVQLPTEDMRPNILNVRQHAIRITMESAGGDCGPDWTRTKGAQSEVV